ncbi:MAG: class I SAM-dependent methyltransferase [Proteobacteria bacterium]|nr:class I SAM-dependent methyltransferase [Pseudomonadota bacterium]
MIDDLAVAYEEESLLAKAEQLSKELNLNIDNQAKNTLFISTHGLALKLAQFSPLYADFSWKTWQKRREEGKKQDIVKACKPKPNLRIVDATAGWGRDSAILASFGAEITMLERHPIMAVLLEDALQRQTEEDKTFLNLKLIKQDAFTYLQELTEYPHLIYLDPMHPERQKSALVKKDMQALQQLIGPDGDVLALLELAKKRTLEKVIVKWPVKLPVLDKTSSSIKGKTIRYDIYQTKL